MSELKEPEWPEDSAFHPKNVGPVNVIQLDRIYDMLTVIAYSVDKEATKRIVDLHKRGQVLAPRPSFSPDGNLDDIVSTNDIVPFEPEA